PLLRFPSARAFGRGGARARRAVSLRAEPAGHAVAARDARHRVRPDPAARRRRSGRVRRRGTRRRRIRDGAPARGRPRAVLVERDGRARDARRVPPPSAGAAAGGQRMHRARRRVGLRRPLRRPRRNLAAAARRTPPGLEATARRLRVPSRVRRPRAGRSSRSRTAPSRGARPADRPNRSRMSEARTISLSLVSHTNVGKTTLARTLLGRDIGIVRDEAHVTEAAEEHTLVETPEGDRLALWDTPGFGDSARLARRLESAGDPIGWFVGQVWDRFRDRALWASQQAVRNVRESADVVLYLVNASEPLAQSRYIDDEMRVLEWIGKPVIVLLNQLGPPRPAAQEAAEIDEWRRHLSRAAPVRSVLPLDAFARCWVQEATLLRAIADALPAEQRGACRRLIDEWLRVRRRVFDASIGALAQALAKIAVDREPIPESGMFDRLRDAPQAFSRNSAENGASVPPARQRAMRALAERLDETLRAATDRMIELHGLGGRATAEIIERLAENYRVS